LRLHRLVTLSVMSFIIWGVELLVFVAIARAYQVDLSIAGFGLFLAAVNFSSLIPAAPGGIGVIEAFATAALVHIGVEREAALSMVATQHLMQFLVVGVPGVFLLLFRFKGKMLADEGELIAEEEKSVSESSEEKGPLSPAALSKAGITPEVKRSVVLPAYNEEHRLPPTLESVVHYLRTQGEQFEVLVVDDGSTDGTAAVVEGYHERYPEVRLLRYQPNRGKGFAVCYGIMQAQGELILFDDADGATPIAEIERLERAIQNGADVAIGSRALVSSETTVKALWYRKVAGRVFNSFANLLLVPGIEDTQCGFKLFRRHAAHQIFSHVRTERFAFDVEVLYLARKFGFRVAEEPVNWSEVPGSRINLASDSVTMFVALLKLRLRDLFGAYALPREGSKKPT
jgi:dolichyl-phosphate beta-glucosyltransferase